MTVHMAAPPPQKTQNNDRASDQPVSGLPGCKAIQRVSAERLIREEAEKLKKQVAEIERRRRGAAYRNALRSRLDQRRAILVAGQDQPDNQHPEVPLSSRHCGHAPRAGSNARPRGSRRTSVRSASSDEPHEDGPGEPAPQTPLCRWLKCGKPLPAGFGGEYHPDCKRLHDAEAKREQRARAKREREAALTERVGWELLARDVGPVGWWQPGDEAERDRARLDYELHRNARAADRPDDLPPGRFVYRNSTPDPFAPGNRYDPEWDRIVMARINAGLNAAGNPRAVCRCNGSTRPGYDYNGWPMCHNCGHRLHGERVVPRALECRGVAK